MYSRRQFLTSSAAAATAVARAGHRIVATAATDDPPAAAPPPADAGASAMARRAIPGSSEEIPVIGMGTSGSFDVGTDAAARDPLREVLRLFFAGGGTLVDTAPSYGSAEDVLGDLLAENGWRERCFLATKIGQQGRDAGLAEFERSLARLRTDKIDLVQIHNLRDWQHQLPLARELQSQGRVRYVGLTHYVEYKQDELADAMQKSKPDFVQINYSVISRGAEKRVLPLAQELGIAVLINRAFEDGRLFGLARDKPLPDWAAEAGIDSWAQAFLRFAWSHPAVTSVIPATADPEHQLDNLGGGHGAALTAEQRESLTVLLA
jgi:aryl-alcohol dehydrogenase-like predicted oxidoreductase